MNKPNVVIYNIKFLFDILDEIKENLNFQIIYIKSLKDLKNLNNKVLNNYLFLSNNTEIQKRKNLKTLIIDKKPHKIEKLIERINISLLKNKFSEQSKISIKNFILDINSRELIKNNEKLKLTQKETEIILYLNSSSQHTTVQDLQKNVWGYITSLETHTVETHIYRLRKKIFKAFKDKYFILSTVNGYKI